MPPIKPELIFQQPANEQDLMRWAEQIHEYLNRREAWTKVIDQAAQEETLWFDVPLRDFFVYDIGTTPTWLPIHASNAQSLHYNDEANPYLGWIHLDKSTGSGDASTEKIFAYYRLPPRYITGRDIKFRISGTATCVGDSTEPSVKTLDLVARRNQPSAGKEGFGENTNWTGGDPWNPGDDWNADLVTTDVQSVGWALAAIADFTTVDFTIEANHATFPLRAGDLLLLELTGAVTSGHASDDAHLWCINPRMGCVVRK